MIHHHASAGMAHDRHATMAAQAEQARLVTQARAARRLERAATPGPVRRLVLALRGVRVSRPQLGALPVVAPAPETPAA